MTDVGQTGHGYKAYKIGALPTECAGMDYTTSQELAARAPHTVAWCLHGAMMLLSASNRQGR